MSQNSPDPSGWHPFVEYPHIYEVQPLGEVQPDPEAEALKQLYEREHGHAFTEPYAVHPDCERCRQDNNGTHPQGYVGPDWYHPYSWTTDKARVMREVPKDEDLRGDTGHGTTAPSSGSHFGFHLAMPLEGWKHEPEWVPQWKQEYFGHQSKVSDAADEEEHPEHQERQGPHHPKHPVLTPYPEVKHPKPPKPQREVRPAPEPKPPHEPTERNPWIHDRGVRSTLNSPVPLDWMSVEHQPSKLAYGEQYDPTICQSCWHPMGAPKLVGGQWMNTCTYCGRSRLVPPNSPLLKQQQQDWPPYPDLLQEVGDNRPWIQARMSFQAPNVTPEPTSSLPNGHHEQDVSDGPDVDQPQGVQVSADRDHLERSAHLNEGIGGVVSAHDHERHENNDDDQNCDIHDYRLAEKRAKSIIRLGQAQVTQKLAYRP